MLFGRSEDAQSRGVSGVASGLGIEFFADPTDVLRLVVDYRKHPAKKEKASCLHCLDIGAERRRRGRELNAEVLQPALRAIRLRTFNAYHRPECAPPST